MNDMLTDENIACKTRACVALTTLLEGPIDVGNCILGRPGIIELMMVGRERRFIRLKMFIVVHPCSVDGCNCNSW